MNFAVSPATDEDVRKIVHVMFKAYGGKNEYINAIFPRGFTEEGEHITARRILHTKSVVDGVIWEKATDTTTGEIVGGAMWVLRKETKPQRFALDGQPGTWKTEDEKEYARALFVSFGEHEARFWEENDLPIMRLSIMAVDPAYQRGGAGTALLQSGLKLSDEVQAVTTVVATFEGKGIYSKFGFELLCEHDLAVPEKFSDRPKCHFWTMVRARRGT